LLGHGFPLSLGERFRAIYATKLRGDPSTNASMFWMSCSARLANDPWLAQATCGVTMRLSSFSLSRGLSDEGGSVSRESIPAPPTRPPASGGPLELPGEVVGG
jgi:hypothetical protein